ncbi:MAG: hypothetical protein DRO99_02410 [Candidatus Aenigmatarchaeota archaeon]|nr:MAG: hypothetical protein DRO99_02410 [Candidatus Aenigmarchaeota archaeon]
MANGERTVFIGLDGVPYGLIERLSDDGTMPNFRRLREDGVFRKMESSIPEISSVSWSSIITGKNPGEHGIFGFTDMIPGSYTLSFPNFNNLRAKPFWHENQGRHVIVNVPSTYPAKELNGFLVSGFVSLDLEKAVYPESYVPKLKEMDYRIDVDAAKGHKSKQLLLDELSKVHGIRMRAVRHLWKEVEWDTFMVVFTGTDRIGHFLWDAWEDPGHELHGGFRNYFKEIDDAIGEITGWMRPEDNLVMCSDHGMELAEVNVNVNRVLRDSGFLKLDDQPKGGTHPNQSMQVKKPLSYSNMLEGTKAFALDPGRIYINMEGKYPRGAVRPEERERVLSGLESLFSNLKVNGKKVIRRTFRREDIYNGPHTGRAPDLILLADKGFNLKASLMDIEKEPGMHPVLTGKHSQDDAFLFVKGSHNRNIINDKPKVVDIRDILDRLQGA